MGIRDAVDLCHLRHPAVGERDYCTGRHQARHAGFLLRAARENLGNELVRYVQDRGDSRFQGALHKRALALSNQNPGVYVVRTEGGHQRRGTVCPYEHRMEYVGTHVDDGEAPRRSIAASSAATARTRSGYACGASHGIGNGSERTGEICDESISASAYSCTSGSSAVSTSAAAFEASGAGAAARTATQSVSSEAVALDAAPSASTTRRYAETDTIEQPVTRALEQSSRHSAPISQSLSCWRHDTSPPPQPVPASPTVPKSMTRTRCTATSAGAARQQPPPAPRIAQTAGSLRFCGTSTRCDEMPRTARCPVPPAP